MLELLVPSNIILGRMSRHPEWLEQNGLQRFRKLQQVSWKTEAFLLFKRFMLLLILKCFLL